MSWTRSPTLVVAMVIAGCASVLGDNRGRQLFYGDAALNGRAYKHLSGLPPEVVRCGNCHSARSGPDVARSAAPRLEPEMLTNRISRRGGPASSYDSHSFCALLERGVDPSGVLVSVDMPRYSITQADCEALWQFLTAP